MSEPFLAEIRIFGFNFAPRGWASCDGQILPINQYQSLFSLLGTNYGGDGRTSFGLPELRGRVPIHVGSGHNIGSISGVESHALSSTEMPQHTHNIQVSSQPGNTPIPNAPDANTLAAYNNAYNDGSALAVMPNVLSSSGAGQSHTNIQPIQVVNFCIALQGLFPSRN